MINFTISLTSTYLSAAQQILEQMLLKYPKHKDSLNEQFISYFMPVVAGGVDILSISPDKITDDGYATVPGELQIKLLQIFIDHNQETKNL
jgi:hypothetical protein